MEAQVHSHQRNVPLSRIQLTVLPVMCAPEVDTARKILPPRMRAGLGFTPILQVRSFMMLSDFLLFNAVCNDCDYLFTAPNLLRQNASEGNFRYSS